MQKIILMTLLIICSSLQISAQTDKADITIHKLEDLKIDVKSLAEWGTRVYSYQIERNGKMTTPLHLR